MESTEFYCDSCNWFTYSPDPLCDQCGKKVRLSQPQDGVNTPIESDSVVITPTELVYKCPICSGDIFIYGSFDPYEEVTCSPCGQRMPCGVFLTGEELLDWIKEYNETSSLRITMPVSSWVERFTKKFWDAFNETIDFHDDNLCDPETLYQGFKSTGDDTADLLRCFLGEEGEAYEGD